LNVSELGEREILLFVGLARIVINADDVVSLAEMTYVRGLIDAIGRDRWHDLAQHARKFGGLDGLLDEARRIEHADSREVILRELRAIAESDELVDSEEKMLQQLQTIWNPA